ncbi:N-acetyltransferase family protein [Pseudomonas cerasi]|uniref:GNAT family N-acetyltransferase n=1 Tax=Pseudomonas cerasi TaxID=1583341 RepID=UPI0039DF4C41
MRTPFLPADVGDVSTFARVDSTQRGVGTLLFERTSHEVRKQGLVSINATIRADNAGGLAFYTRLGFVDHSLIPSVPLNDGTPVNRISKRYRLR